MNGASIFSTLNLKSCYWQVLMDEASIPKTAFVTKNAQYKFVCLLFGLRNSDATFQRLINIILRKCIRKFCLVYLDGIVIYSKNIQEHFGHLKQLFDKLEAAGLTFNLSKCNLLHKSIIFLGHVVSAVRVCTETAKVDAFQNFPVPTTLKEVQCFLGLAS